MSEKFKYSQFYEYLDSADVEEIKNCVHNVIQLARKHSIAFDSEGAESGKTNPFLLPHAHSRLQVSQQAWFQHAVWNKFGSSAVDHPSLKSLEHATAKLFASISVAEFIIRVNNLIDEATQDLDPQYLASAYLADIDTDEEWKNVDFALVSAHHKLQVSRRVWSQLAVWNKFGSNTIEHPTLMDLALAVKSIPAAGYTLQVDRMVDDELRQHSGDTVIHEERRPAQSAAHSSAQNRASAEVTPPHSQTSSSSSGTSNTNLPEETSEEDEESAVEVLSGSDSEIEEHQEKSDTAAVRTSGRKLARKAPCVWDKRKKKQGSKPYKHWTESDEVQLQGLVRVGVQQCKPLNWVFIGKCLGRTPASCCSKWQKMGIAA